MNIIEARNLTKVFPAKGRSASGGNGLTAVNQVSFGVTPGEIFGFLGPNGAGKSTTINMLATLTAPTSGEAFINGWSSIFQRNEVRRSIGLVFQDPSLDDRLTAEENLYFHARLYNVPRTEYQLRMPEVLNLVDLWDRRGDIVKSFSGGMKRRLEIARGFIHYPAILFLDEPTLGLDPQTRAHLWDYILRLKHEKGMTIFMTTHYMNEAEYCDRIAIIDHGQIVAMDTPANLKKLVGGDVIKIESLEKAKLKEELLQRYQISAREDEEAIYIDVSEGETFLPRLLKEVEVKIEAVELRRPTLDNVFLHLTGRTIRDEEASTRDLMRQGAFFGR